MTPSDAELLAAAGRDPAAFRQLYDRHAEHLHRFFQRRTGSHEAALDLTAETFARAWLHRRRFRDRRGGSVAPWLYGIARNVLRQSVRRQRTADEAVVRLGLAQGTDGLHAAPASSWIDDLDADIERALAELPEGQRRAVELRVADDRSYDDVAHELGCTPVAARIRVSRALERLRRTMEDPT